MKSPAWLPDWTDPRQYPDANSSPTLFAWEFLRRNPDYQAAYAETVAPIKARHADGKPYQYSPPLEPEENAVLLALADRFGLSAPVFPAPESDNPEPFLLKGHRGAAFPEPTAYQKADGKVLLELDLAFPLDIQWHRLERLLRSMQDEFKERGGEVYNQRHQWTNLPHYLRTLDAEACGATRAEMAEVLLPDIDNSYPDYSASGRIDKWLQVAREYRDHRYALLVVNEKSTAHFPG